MLARAACGSSGERSREAAPGAQPAVLGSVPHLTARLRPGDGPATRFRQSAAHIRRSGRCEYPASGAVPPITMGATRPRALVSSVQVEESAAARVRLVRHGRACQRICQRTGENGLERNVTAAGPGNAK